MAFWDLGASGLLASGASLVSNLFGQQNQQSINAQNMWAQNIANQQNMGLARENRDVAINESRHAFAQNVAQQDKINALVMADKEKDRALQQDFAQMGIKWRVEDAERAGVHPLFALGGGGAAYAPSAISLGAAQAAPASIGGPAQVGASRSVAGNSFANMGQDVSRALLATQTSGLKNEAFETAYQDLSLKNLALKNDLIASQIARNTQAGGVQKSVGGDWPSFEHSATDIKPVMVDGSNVVVGSKSSGADEWENRYGEIGELIGGTKNLLQDAAAHPGAAYRWFQWLNNQMITEQMVAREQALERGTHWSQWPWTHPRR